MPGPGLGKGEKNQLSRSNQVHLLLSTLDCGYDMNLCDCPAMMNYNVKL